MKIGSGQPDQIQTSGTMLVWGSGDNEAGQHRSPWTPFNRNRNVIRHDADLDNSVKVSLAMFDDCDALCKLTGRRCAQHFTNGKFRCRRAALLAALWRRQIGKTSRPSTARLAVPHLHKNISRLYIHRFTNCRRLRQAYNHHVGPCGTSPICRFTVFVAAEARVPCQFHAAAAFESFPRQLVLLLLREDFQAPIPFCWKLIIPCSVNG